MSAILVRVHFLIVQSARRKRQSQPRVLVSISGIEMT